MLNTHTHLVYTDDHNSTWRITTRTLPSSSLAFSRHLYFFLLFSPGATQQTASKHTYDSSTFPALHQTR